MVDACPVPPPSAAAADGPLLLVDGCWSSLGPALDPAGGPRAVRSLAVQAATSRHRGRECGQGGACRLGG